MKKLNNKGFTLVELLAVIVILIVIVSIAIPTISSTLERQKQKTVNAQKELLASAAELFLSDNEDKFNYNSTRKCEVHVDDLTSNDYISKKAIDKLSDTTCYTYQNQKLTDGCSGKITTCDASSGLRLVDVNNSNSQVEKITSEKGEYAVYFENQTQPRTSDDLSFNIIGTGNGPTPVIRVNDNKTSFMFMIPLAVASSTNFSGTLEITSKKYGKISININYNTNTSDVYLKPYLFIEDDRSSIDLKRVTNYNSAPFEYKPNQSLSTEREYRLSIAACINNTCINWHPGMYGSPGSDLSYVNSLIFSYSITQPGCSEENECISIIMDETSSDYTGPLYKFHLLNEIADTYNNGAIRIFATSGQTEVASVWIDLPFKGYSAPSNTLTATLSSGESILDLTKGKLVSDLMYETGTQTLTKGKTYTLSLFDCERSTCENTSPGSFIFNHTHNVSDSGSCLKIEKINDQLYSITPEKKEGNCSYDGAAQLYASLDNGYKISIPYKVVD